jgi:hypothetical protein
MTALTHQNTAVGSRLDTAYMRASYITCKAWQIVWLLPFALLVSLITPFYLRRLCTGGMLTTMN